MRRGLIPHLKDAKQSGLRALLKKDKLVVYGRTYDLVYMVKNIQLGVKSDGLDIPVKNIVETSEEISQQRTENTGSDCTKPRALQRDNDQLQ
jgi:hypothetical protein